MRRRRRIAAAVIGVAAALAAVLIVDDPRGTPGAPAADREGTALLPEPVEPAFKPKLRPVDFTTPVNRWAAVVRAVDARRSPGGNEIIARLATTTPEGTANIVLLQPGVETVRGRLWVRVRLPVLPNNTTGWVPRDALGGYGEARTRLVVDRRLLTATLLRDGRELFRAPIGVGEPQWPTPAGEFYVRNKLTTFADPFYGPVAFGTSARSAVLTDWPAGGFIGIHGTNRPDLLPGRVSHGCIRMANEDILRLARLMPVGTPITIR
ncbi:MAG TPA: L,D-transpeptidase [Gaiellaceae bacterium]|nr:L,D-transpeptidase [Gaiellaceae bacterium]